MNGQGEQEKRAGGEGTRKARWTSIRIVELALLVIGLVCAAIFATARLDGYLASRAAIQQFEGSMQTKTITQVADDQTRNIAQPNFSGWSEGRVRAYAGAAQQRGIALAVLEIPRIQLTVPVFDGTDELTLNRGAGLIAGTAWPGELGNVGIAGHRDGFFRKLKDIRTGDEIELHRHAGTDVYTADKIQVVTPRDISVLQSDEEPSLTLVTCYPFYSIGGAPKRFAVKAHLKRHNPAGTAATATRPDPQPVNPALEEQ